MWWFGKVPPTTTLCAGSTCRLIPVDSINGGRKVDSIFFFEKSTNMRKKCFWHLLECHWWSEVSYPFCLFFCNVVVKYSCLDQIIFYAYHWAWGLTVHNSIKKITTFSPMWWVLCPLMTVIVCRSKLWTTYLLNLFPCFL